MRIDSFKNFTDKVLAFPLWVKQIIYFYLKEDLQKVFGDKSVDINPYDLYQKYQPKITFVGRKEIEERNHMHEEIMYTFLKAVADNKSIIDITLDCFMTLEEVSKLFLEALEKEYVMSTSSKVILGTAEFLAGKIKTGEYLFRIGRLSVDQLDVAIRQMNKVKSNGEKYYMAELLSSLGFIEKDEIVAILIMKEEAKKRFIFNMEVTSTQNASAEIIKLQKLVQKLAYENNYLKMKLKEILKIN